MTPSLVLLCSEEVTAGVRHRSLYAMLINMAVEYSISKILGRHQNVEYFLILQKLLVKYFGSAFRELGTVFIVITIRTKFSDII